MNLLGTDIFLRILVIAWAGCGIIQLIYYLLIFLPVLSIRRRQQKMSAPSDRPPVSVIVYVHNEAEKLSEYLPLLIGQDYPEFEIIVVDNASKDDTSSVILVLQQQCPFLRYSEIKGEPAFVNSAYFAQTIGVKAAKYDLLLFTEAHCRPSGPRWLSSMQQAFTRRTDFVLGYCRYTEHEGFLNSIIRYDRFFHTVMGFGMAQTCRPYMGYGGNIGYRRPIFYEHNGFMHVAHVPVGNTPLYIPEAAHSRDTTLMLLPESFMEEEPVTTWKEWVRLRRKQQVAQRYYGFFVHFVWALELITRLLFYTLTVWLLLRGDLWMYVAGGLLLRFAVQMAVLVPLLRLLTVRRMWWKIPLYDVLVYPLILLALWVSQFFASFRRPKYNY